MAGHSYYDYFQVYKYAPLFSDLKNQAFTKALELARTPKECTDISMQSSEADERELAQEKAKSLAYLADTIEAHLTMYYYGDGKEAALDAALDLATTFEDCLVIYDSCDEGLPRRKALEKMKKIWQESQ